MVEIYKGPTKREKEFYERQNRERAIEALKQAGWRATTDMPFWIIDQLEGDPAVRLKRSSITGHVYDAMREILAAEAEGYEAQNTKLFGKQKFVSPDLAAKILEKVKDRNKKNVAGE